MKFKELLEKLKDCFFEHKSELETNYGKDIYSYGYMYHNIYEEQKYSEYAKNFKTLHVKMKYRFIVPIVVIFYYLFQKYLDKKIPDKSWNVNIKVFEKSWDKSVFLWKKHMLDAAWKRTKRTDAEIQEDIDTQMGLSLYLRTVKKAIIATALDDTAYRELLNILMINIAQEMYFTHGSHINHLFWNSHGGIISYDFYAMNFENTRKIVKIYESDKDDKDNILQVPEVHVVCFPNRYGNIETSAFLFRDIIGTNCAWDLWVQIHNHADTNILYNSISFGRDDRLYADFNGRSKL